MLIPISCLFIIAITGILFATEVEDGFGPSKSMEGRYFTIYYSPQIDMSQLSRQLNITAADKILAGKSIGEDIASEPELAKMIDILYGLVGDMVDMHIYNFWIAPNVGIVKFIHTFIQFKYIQYLAPEAVNLMNRYNGTFVEIFDLKKAIIDGKVIGR